MIDRTPLPDFLAQYQGIDLHRQIIHSENRLIRAWKMISSVIFSILVWAWKITSFIFPILFTILLIYGLFFFTAGLPPRPAPPPPHPAPPTPWVVFLAAVLITTVVAVILLLARMVIGYARDVYRGVHGQRVLTEAVMKRIEAFG